MSIRIHQELDSSGALIIDVLADFIAQLANFGALRVGEVGRGGTLDDLLIAPLDRAITLE